MPGPPAWPAPCRSTSERAGGGGRPSTRGEQPPQPDQPPSLARTHTAHGHTKRSSSSSRSSSTDSKARAAAGGVPSPLSTAAASDVPSQRTTHRRPRRRSTAHSAHLNAQPPSSAPPLLSLLRFLLATVSSYPSHLIRRARRESHSVYVRASKTSPMSHRLGIWRHLPARIDGRPQQESEREGKDVRTAETALSKSESQEATLIATVHWGHRTSETCRKRDGERAGEAGRGEGGPSHVLRSRPGQANRSSARQAQLCPRMAR